MKKKLFVLLFAALLLICLALPAFAEEFEVHVYVFDQDGILDAEDVAELEKEAAQFSNAYDCGIYVAVFNDMAEHGFYDIEEFSEEIYRQWNLGYGDQRDGILLVMSMAERDYDLAAHGDFGNYAFTDYGKEALADQFLDDFRRNDWASGFHDYIGSAAALIKQARDGEPFDYVGYGEDSVYTYQERSTSEKLASGGLGGTVLGLLTALISGSSMKRKMKTAVAATDASDYVADHGVFLTAQEDRFTHATVIRQHIARDTDRDSGHSHSGGTSVNSSGFSHHSGKF